MRQLAAIMFADIAGFTALMQENEALALELRNKLKNKLETEIAIHGGRVIKYSGDGALCSFDSAIESVRVAIAVQLEMQKSPVVPLRIGIHQADVIFDDGDVHGDGVNIASRLESFAINGSIFISAKVQDDIKNQNDIETVSLGKYTLKNVIEPIEIFAISNSGLQVPLKKKLEGKGLKFVNKQFSIKKNTLMIRVFALLLILALAYYFIVPPILKKQYAKNTLIPKIQKLVEENFRPPTEAYDLALEAYKYIPKDSVLNKLLEQVASTFTIVTEPEGVEVFWKDYEKLDAPWRSAGITPIVDAKFPRSYLRMEFRKDGYQTIEYAGPGAYWRLGPDIDTLMIDAINELPENMARIPQNISYLFLVGLEQHGGKIVEEFLMDKFEVTNKQFKKFMDDGGYDNSTFWNYPIISGGKTLSLEEAKLLFVDRTSRTGPSTWEAGSYIDGTENQPVSGVSWYEAAAYAKYAGKQLPTIFHWGLVAETSRTEMVVPLSNLGGKSIVDVGSKPGYCSFGIYDLAGNVREWCFNSSNNDEYKYILGGGFNDPTYAFNDSYVQQAIDRSATNGFRCMQTLPGDKSMAILDKDVPMAFRNFKEEKPVDDATFNIFLRQFVYDKNPLNATIDSVLESEFWTAEKITFDAGYNNEQLQAYLYLPKNQKGPYQTIIFFPGSGDLFSRKYDPQTINRIDFILKSGRAIMRPIYKGTHERFSEINSDLPAETALYKDHVSMWCKEVSRSIDYLETRKDIQSDKIGYLGWSWGGFMGGIIPAVEKRISCVVLNVGGMCMTMAFPESDQINYLPRVTQPTLMLNGKYDMYFPVETSQKPMFNFLGTPANDKKLIIYESGHLVPRAEFLKESLFWYDKYLGKTQ